MKKKLMLAIFVIICIFVVPNTIVAEDLFDRFGEYGNISRSASCATSICATDVSDRGVRVSLYNSSASPISSITIGGEHYNVNATNFWNSNSFKNSLNNIISTCTNNKCTEVSGNTTIGTWFNRNIRNVYYSNIRVSDDNSIETNPSVKMYETFSNNTFPINATGVSNIKTIIGGIFNVSNASKIESLYNYLSNNNYYLKLEPIFNLHFALTGSGFSVHYYMNYIGTSNEIINYMWSDTWFRSNGANIYSRGFVLGGCGNYEISSHTNTYNVIGNYIKSLYITSSSRPNSHFSSFDSAFNSASCSSGKNLMMNQLLDAYCGDITESNSCSSSTSRSSGLGASYIQINKYITDYTLNIEKYAEVDRGGGVINKYANYINQNVKFDLYDSAGHFIGSCTTGADGNPNGRCKIDNVKSGNGYILKEVIPSGYSNISNDASCNSCVSEHPTSSVESGKKIFSYTLNMGNADKTIKISNTKNCASDFDLQISSGSLTMLQRIALYEYYYNGAGGQRYNQLLDLTQRTGSDACKYVPKKTNSSSSCLKFSVDSNYFNSNNLSGYNSTLDLGETVGYCFTSVKFDPKVNIPFSTDPIIAGKMAVKSDVAAHATVTKKCYLKKSTYIYPETTSDTTSDYLGNIYLEFENNNYSGSNKYVQYIVQPESVGLVATSSGNKSAGSMIEFKAEVDYKFVGIYSQYGNNSNLKYNNNFDDILDFSGEYKSYRYLGRGIISNFNIANNTTYTVGEDNNFSAIYIHKNILNYDASETGTDNLTLYGTCKYDVEKKIINPELKLQFREVDTMVPFPGKKGNVEENQRAVGFNWRSDDIALDFFAKYNSVIENEIEYEDFLTTVGYDLNKDGKFDEADLNIYNYANSLGDKTAKINGNNYLVKFVMNSRNDSYNKTGEGIIYSIDLDPTLIKKIREYNRDYEYDNYDTLDCSSGECVSTFLRDFLEKPFIN